MIWRVVGGRDTECSFHSSSDLISKRVDIAMFCISSCSRQRTSGVLLTQGIGLTVLEENLSSVKCWLLIAVAGYLVRCNSSRKSSGVPRSRSRCRQAVEGVCKTELEVYTWRETNWGGVRCGWEVCEYRRCCDVVVLTLFRYQILDRVMRVTCAVLWNLGA